MFGQFKNHKDVEIYFQLGRLMVYMLSSRQEFDDRTYIISYLIGELRGREILKLVLNTSHEQVC